MMESWRTSAEMARCLVGYIDCDRRVYAALKAEFNDCISLGSITQIRAREARHAAKRKAGSREGQRFTWAAVAPNDLHANAMQDASARLLHAIMQEAAGLKAADILEKPETVDRAWEREALKARLHNA